MKEQENIICGIYKITSPKMRMYVGQSVDIEKRRGEYNRLMNCKGQLRLYNSLKKYGWKNHKFEIIHLCKESELNKLEIYYIDLLQTFNTFHGLNLTRGGDGVMKDKHHTKESKEKSRQSNSGENNHMLGKTYEEIYGVEKANKMKKEKRKAFTGKNNPRYGVKILDSTREKLRISHLGKKQSEESNEKNRKANLGKNNAMFGKVGFWADKKRSKEDIENMKEGWKKRQSKLNKVA